MQYHQRRMDGVLEHAIEDEVVVYDTATDQSHLLNAPTASVWRALAAGVLSTDAIIEAVSDRPELVELALAELARVGLLDSVPVVAASAGRLTRRQMLRAMGVAAVAAPVIVTLSAPPVAAQTTCNQICGDENAEPVPEICSNSLGTCQCLEDLDPGNPTGYRCQAVG